MVLTSDRARCETSKPTGAACCALSGIPAYEHEDGRGRPRHGHYLGWVNRLWGNRGPRVNCCRVCGALAVAPPAQRSMARAVGRAMSLSRGGGGSIGGNHGKVRPGLRGRPNQITSNPSSTISRRSRSGAHRPAAWCPDPYWCSRTFVLWQARRGNWRSAALAEPVRRGDMAEQPNTKPR